jgi:serine/threonine-protein kinase RsbW
MSGPDTIELSVPLRPEYAAQLRLLVASVGSEAGFTVDELDDLRLAVSEVFTLLLQDADVDRTARAVLQVTIDDPGVTMTVGRTGAAEVPEIDALATTILTAVVDDFSVVPGGVALSKRAVESAASP